MSKKNDDVEEDPSLEPDANLGLLRAFESVVNSIDNELDEQSVLGESEESPPAQPIVDYSNEKLIELLERAQKGDSEARKLLLLQSLRYARKLRSQWKDCETEEILQLGMCGMQKAIEKFDKTNIVDCSSYLIAWIRNYISDNLANGIIRTPKHVLTKIREIAQSAQDLEMDLGREPTIHEVADVTKLKIQSVQKLQDLATRQIVSLESLLSSEEPWSSDVGDLGTSTQDPEYRAEDNERKEFVYYLMMSTPLEPRELAILYLRFGFGGEPMTLEEVGNLMGYTRERVRQLQVSALQKLRALSSEVEARHFLD